MRPIIWPILALLASPAFAVLNSAAIVLPLQSNRAAPAVTIVQPADYLCAVVTLRTTAKDPERQSNAMRDALQRVHAIVEKSPRFELHQGPARFSEGSTSVFSSRAGSGPASLQTSLRILCPLNGSADVFDAMKDLRKFIGTFANLDEVELTVASISLGVISPEQFRDRLLALIADQSRSVQRSLNARTVIIDGLQNPVIVHQVDDVNVELFIDYQMSATTEVR